MSDTEHRAAGVCPIIDIDYRENRPAFWNWASLDEVRELGTFVWDETPRGFWMFNRYAEVREALNMGDVFTNRVTGALSNPENRVRLLPQNTNGEEHVRFRHAVNPWFSPGSVRKVMPFARERCIELIEALKPQGSCDLAREFAMIFPTEVFLHMLGLPIEHGATLLPLVEGMFRGFFGGDPAEMAKVVAELRGFWADVVDDRIANLRDPESDFVSHLLTWKVEGEEVDPISREDVITLAYTIMIAGLDTTRSALGYTFHHLATHPEHRAVLVEQPDRIPDAVEEMLRLYGLLLQDGRYVARDIEFHGCPMKEGDVIWLGLAAANRDPRMFENPTEFVLDRESNKHIAFGAGAHRCLGAHLARAELVMVLEEWLKRIPDFGLSDNDPIIERGGQLMLTRVPLTWEV